MKNGFNEDMLVSSWKQNSLNKDKVASLFFKRKQMFVTEFWRVAISPIFLAVFYAADFITITILSYVIFAKSRKLWTKYNFPKFKNPSSFKFDNENRLL